MPQQATMKGWEPVERVSLRGHCVTHGNCWESKGGVDLCRRGLQTAGLNFPVAKKLLKENSYRHGALVWVFFSIGFYQQNLEFNWNLIYQ